MHPGCKDHCRPLARDGERQARAVTTSRVADSRPFRQSDQTLQSRSVSHRLAYVTLELGPPRNLRLAFTRLNPREQAGQGAREQAGWRSPALGGGLVTGGEARLTAAPEATPAEPASTRDRFSVERATEPSCCPAPLNCLDGECRLAAARSIAVGWSGSLFQSSQ